MSNPRWAFERAVLGSELPPLTRLALLTLAAHVDGETGTIPPGMAPSFATLIAETGMSRSTLAGHLKRAETDGWLKRTVPTKAAARRHHAKTTYALTIPELVRETHQPSPGDELAQVREPNQASSGAVLELVREPNQASSGAEHRSEEGLIDRSDRDVLTTIQDTIRAETGREVSRDWAAQVHRQILGDRPGVRNATRYVMTAIRREPARFVPTLSEPNGALPVPRVAPVGERDNPANQSGAAMARRLLADKAAN